MRTFIYAAATATFLAALPASAQMMGDGGMGMRSCVMNGQFVPCPPGNMMGGPGMAQGGMMGQPGMAPERRMTRAEMRAEQRRMRQQGM